MPRRPPRRRGEERGRTRCRSSPGAAWPELTAAPGGGRRGIGAASLAGLVPAPAGALVAVVAARRERREAVLLQRGLAPVRLERHDRYRAVDLLDHAPALPEVLEA